VTKCSKNNTLALLPCNTPMSTATKAEKLTECEQ